MQSYLSGNCMTKLFIFLPKSEYLKMAQHQAGFGKDSLMNRYPWGLLGFYDKLLAYVLSNSCQADARLESMQWMFYSKNLLIARTGAIDRDN